MATADLSRFLLLAAIWGSSYMFMRVAVPGFGPVPLVMVRMIGAAGFFLPWLLRAPIRPLLRRSCCFRPAGHRHYSGRAL